MQEVLITIVILCLFVPQFLRKEAHFEEIPVIGTWQCNQAAS